MHRRMINSLLALLIVLAAAPAPAPLAAQAQENDRFFPETGYIVPGRFLAYWNANGGLPIFGYPITPVTFENGYAVQYFERNRFEYHPENNPPHQILLGLLGARLTDGRSFPRVSAFQDTADRVYFEPTGHSLGGVFLRYWRDYGGLALFGYPISEEMDEVNPTDGKTYRVQYFQRNRFEYHPEHAGTRHEVLLGLLGRDFLEKFGPKKLPLTGAPFPNYQATPPANLANAPAGPFKAGPQGELGLFVDMYYKDRKKILDAVQDLGVTWIKQQVQWRDIEGSPGRNAWAELELIIADVAARRDLKLAITVVKPPRWANGGGDGYPTDPQYLYNFMKAMAEHYRGKVHAYQIWNEQNLFGESANLSPARYAEILKAGYQGVKAGDPNAIVLFGGLTPTGIYDQRLAVEDTWFLDQVYQWNNGEIRNYFDVLGSHPYGYNNPPDTMWPDNQSKATGFTTHGQFYFRRVEQQRQIMEKFNDGQKQVWLTEWGWCSDVRPDGYNICAETSRQQQADYTIRALRQAKESYPWMGVMFLWNLNFSTFQEWYTGPAHFSVVNGDWTPRPVYTAIKDYLRLRR